MMTATGRPHQGHQKLPSGAAREALRETGQFWTPDWVADAMVAFVLDDGAEAVFDPAVGAGAFFRAVRRRSATVALHGAELSPAALEQALAAGVDARDLAGAEVRDFVLDPPAGPLPAIVANPPYIRHHRLDRSAKARLRRFCLEFLGQALDGRAGLHVYFLLRALERLRDGGRLAFIVPADITEGVFAPILWRHLGERFRIEAVVTFTPEAAPFPKVDTNALIVFMTKARPHATLHWAECSQPCTRALARWTESGFAVQIAGIDAVRRPLEEALRTGLSRAPQSAARPETPLGEFARVVRGIATGANDFFFLNSQQIRDRNLPLSCFHRAIGRTRDLEGDAITPADLERLDNDGRPTFLLALNGGPISKPVRAYLDEGEAQGLNQRALIRSRRPWFRMETRTPPPLLFSYLGRRRVRFIRNQAGVVPLTGFLCVYPRPEYASPERVAALWAAFNNPRTLENLRRVGKSYGDGAVKVEPRALERLPIPHAACADAGLPLPGARAQRRLTLG